MSVAFGNGQVLLLFVLASDPLRADLCCKVTAEVFDVTITIDPDQDAGSANLIG